MGRFPLSLLLPAVLLLFFSTFPRLVLGAKETAREAALKTLMERIAALQQPKSTTVDLPFQFARTKGLFRSAVHINTVGDGLGLSELRNDLSIADNNVFVTSWVLAALLEAENVKGGPKIAADLLGNALAGVAGAKARSFGPQIESNAPVFSFWKQVACNSTGRQGGSKDPSGACFRAWPANLEACVEDEDAFLEWVELVLTELGLTSLKGDVAFVYDMIVAMAAAFQIPPDFDDSAAALVLRFLLDSAGSAHEQSAAFWRKRNSDIAQLAAFAKRYAYRPFAMEIDASIIDPRTYFFMHEYLESLDPKARHGFTTTWIMDIGESRAVPPPGVIMPFNGACLCCSACSREAFFFFFFRTDPSPRDEVNNVDMSVASNTIYGFVSNAVQLAGSTKKLPSWFDSELADLLTNTTDLVAWSIETGRARSRPDIGMLYYPPIHDLYWFFARTVFLLENTLNEWGSLPASLGPIYERAARAMRGAGTDQILAGGQVDTEKGWMFWDGFLGENDVDAFGFSTPHHDDRLFTTAVAVNTLLDAWTRECGAAELCFLASTPASVKSALIRGVAFLVAQTEDSSYQPLNAFFSGSVKGTAQQPWAFPANYLFYVNGTRLSLNQTNTVNISPTLIFGMRGVVNAAEYQRMVKEKHFGADTPVEFPATGFNASPFPFWCSEALTWSFMLRAIAKHAAIVQ
jgi:hypothetical protein